jgi:archaellum biogenesis ATPase FlaH
MSYAVGVVLPSNNYDDMLESIFHFMSQKPNVAWIYVSITNPFESLKHKFEYLMNNPSISCIDCVSRAAGIQSIDPQCFYLDSPAELEKLILEIVSQVRKHMGQETYVVIDSLSSLVLYNDMFLVSEFFTHLINNIKINEVKTITLCIEEEMNEYLNKVLYLKNDKIIKVRESFI